MNKLWYILKENNRFGPFDENELQRMFSDKRIHVGTTLIRRGVKRHIPLGELIKRREKRRNKTLTSINPFREFPYRLNTKPIIPKQTKDIKVNQAVHSPKRKTWFSNLQNELLDTFQIIKNKNFVFGSGIFLAICCGLFFLLSQYDEANRIDLERPTNVHKKDFRKFERTIKSSYDKRKVSWNILHSKDTKNMWLGTSLPGESEIELEFTSKDKKTLSKDPVSFTTRFFINDSMAPIDDLKFLEGSKVVPGFYTVKLNLIRRNLSFWEKVFTPKFSEKEFYQTEILIGAQSKRNFLKELKNFHQKLAQKENAFLQDVTMKYQTLLTISERISGYLLRAKNYKSRRQIKFMKKDFLKGYQNKYGAFFSNFMVENESKFKELTEKSSGLNSGMVAHYSFLSKVAKNLGIISVDALAGFDQLSTNRSAFDNVIERYQALIAKCKEKLQSLEI